MFFTGTLIGEFNPIWICMVVSSGKVWLGTFCRDARGIFLCIAGLIRAVCWFEGNEDHLVQVVSMRYF